MTRALAALLAVIAVAFGLAACGSSAAPRGLAVKPLTDALEPTYAAGFHASGRGSHRFAGLRVQRHVQIVGSCSGGRFIAVAIGEIRGEIFCNGTGTAGGIASIVPHSPSMLVIRTTPGTRWAVLLGNHA